jgi:pimeloyl-ACP methyl ester carboxylesterase
MRSGLFGIEKETYNNASSREKEQLNNVLNLLLPVKPRKPGIINDEEVTNIDMNKNYDQYILENINVSTLIIHAENDPMASYEDAKTMSERIPNSKFVSYEKGGHILFGYQKEIQDTIKGYLTGAN